MSVAIVWLRRDLRVHDHPALRAAHASADQVLPVFCFDRRLLQGRHRSGARTQFMLECLKDLDASLKERGSRLILREGVPERELTRLVHHLKADAVHATADVGPFARRRDVRAQQALAAVGARLHLHPGLFAVDDPAGIKTKQGKPYTLFTPFYRVWLGEPRRAPAPAPQHVGGAGGRLRKGSFPTLAQLNLPQEAASPAPGGERAARARLDEFLLHRVDRYGEDHNRLARPGTSGLSPYLHFGCLSARELESRLPESEGGQEFRRQLCWRDFYAQVLHEHPANARREYQRRYRGTLRWSRARSRFDAWREGRTGYPIVDAAMRQLQCEGWMHNRGRLIVGSFLTKDLGIDWRWGEGWFMRMLIDGDEANNNGNWQWIASVGVDPQPPARRILNPARQQARFDPDGEYVRRYVPELKNVPDRYLAEPWTMPEEIQTRAGCRIGRDYPRPVVDHAAARREALGRYSAAGGGASASAGERAAARRSTTQAISRLNSNSR
jgi:deoxyribodipyrimidine photo-lyase